jgi:hypothetical protein
LGECVVQLWRDLPPKQFRVVDLEMIHGCCFRFAASSAFFTPNRVDGGVARGLMNPAGE